MEESDALKMGVGDYISFFPVCSGEVLESWRSHGWPKQRYDK